MLTKVFDDVLLNILNFVDPKTENALICTAHSLKETILLQKRRYNNYYYSCLPNKNAYVFNLFQRSYQWLPSIENIQKRLSLVLEDFFPLAKIHHVILAGGSLLTVLDNRIAEDGLQKNPTDLDFFIYGEKEQKIEALNQICKFLTPFSPKYYVRNNVVDIFIKNKRHVQLVLIDVLHPYEIVTGFDLGYVQFFFDGVGLYGTHLGLIALCDHSTIAIAGQLSRDRHEKAIKKGFQILEQQHVIQLLETSDILKRSRFFVSCIRRVVDELDGWTDPAILSTLHDELNVNDLIDKSIPWHGTYGTTFTFSRFYGDTIPENMQLGEERNIGVISSVSLVYPNGSPFIIMSCPLRVKYRDDIEYDTTGRKYTKITPSSLDSYLNHVKTTMVGKLIAKYPDYRTRITNTASEDDRTIRLKDAKDKITVDRFSVSYEKEIVPGDTIVCEIDFKLYFTISRRKRQLEAKFFVCQVRKIIVL
jgi:hypothetical protein